MSIDLDRTPDARSAPVGRDPILEAHDLHRTFRLGAKRIQVLDGASMSVGRGEVLAVVGLSGVGKSTLLHILGGLDTPDGGSLIFERTDVFAAGAGARARFRNRSVGFVFQFHHLLPEFTARENVLMPLRIAGREGAAASRADELLRQVGLAERADHRPAELSGGEQQRVAVARALVNDPALLLADEPSGNLDPETGDLIYDLLFDLRERLGQSIVVTTHSMELAARADRVLELRDGRLHPRG